jgi:hypothetical protein
MVTTSFKWTPALITLPLRCSGSRTPPCLAGSQLAFDFVADEVVEPARWIQAANRLDLARDHGQALVETALALSLLVFTLMGGADIARVYAATLAKLGSFKPVLA